MANSGISMPGSFGGLMRYNEEYPSKLTLKPAHVVGFVIGVLVFCLVLKIFFPIATPVA
jgi:preprotein translocase subunit Sec61beta